MITWPWLPAHPALFREQYGVQKVASAPRTLSSGTHPWARVVRRGEKIEQVKSTGNVSGGAGRCQRCCRGVNKLSVRIWEEIHTPHPPRINRTPQVSIRASYRITSSAVVWSPPSRLLVGIWWCICLLCFLWFWIFPVHHTCNNKICDYHDALIITSAISNIMTIISSSLVCRAEKLRAVSPSPGADKPWEVLL